METGLTLRRLASKANVSPGYISQVERGHKEASSALLNEICCALGSSLSDVLRETAASAGAEEARSVDAAA
jgi:transcriptional regulator with XRE-family HTH domain